MNLSENRILTQNELAELYRVFRNGYTAEGIHPAIIIQLKNYLNGLISEALININNYMIANPETDFEYWAKRNTGYAWPLDVLNYLNNYNTNPDKAGLTAEEAKNKLSLRQVALIHAYEEKPITKANASEIAESYNHQSGQKLYQYYCEYCKASNRKAKPTADTKRTLKNKIELFESVVIHLSDSKKKRAVDEINILKTSFECEYQ